MAKVYLTSVYEDGRPYDPNLHFALHALRQSARIDQFGLHALTDCAQDAEIVLFAEMALIGMFAEPIRAHPIYRRHAQKCFLYDWSDHFWPVVPGIYASLREQHYALGHTRSGFYLQPENPYIDHRPVTGREAYLASFVGSFETHPVRWHFAELGRPGIYVSDTSEDSYRVRYHGTPREKEVFYRRYADAMADALFSLCPRGYGSGSVRLYESMKLGRACIILSDEWVPNDGVDWPAFSVRVPEAEVHRLPDVLECHRTKAAEMGLRARAEWELWFSEPVRFHRMVELCLAIRAHREHGLRQRLRDHRHLLPPSNWLDYARSKVRLYKQTKKLYWY
jgi:hypothetical protein